VTGRDLNELLSHIVNTAAYSVMFYDCLGCSHRINVNWLIDGLWCGVLWSATGRGYYCAGVGNPFCFRNCATGTVHASRLPVKLRWPSSPKGGRATNWPLPPLALKRANHVFGSSGPQ